MEQNYVVPNIYQDISNQGQGYFAFRFTCQQCYWQIDTRPIRSTVSTVSNIADIGIGLIGGFWGRAAEAGQKIYGSKWHQEQADALQKSWREVQHHFHFCPKCQETVCNKCWNQTLGLCLRDAPDLKADGASFQHAVNIESQRQQIQQNYHAPQFNINAIPSAVTPDMVQAPRQQQQLPPAQQPAAITPAAIAGFSTPGFPDTVNCPTCRRPGKPGKFCQDCGTKLPEPHLFCPNCSTPVETNSRFCQDCGTNLKATQ